MAEIQAVDCPDVISEDRRIELRWKEAEEKAEWERWEKEKEDNTSKNTLPQQHSSFEQSLKPPDVAEPINEDLDKLSPP